MLHVDDALTLPGSVEIRRRYEIELSREEYQFLRRLRQLTRQHGIAVLLVESNRDTLRWRCVGPAEG